MTKAKVKKKKAQPPVDHKGQKAGPWSAEEKAFIVENADKMTFEEIARRLKRNPESVHKYLNKIGHKTVKSEKVVTNPEYDIKRSPLWKVLKTEFSEEELELFLYHWSRIISQFKDDVLPTEELQIIEEIKIEILLSRCLKNQRAAMKLVEEAELEVESLQSQQVDPILIDQAKRSLAFHQTAIRELGQGYNDLLNKKNALLKDLKATRSERIKHIEESKHTILGWITQLIQNKNLRRELGIEMEKMRVATEIEKYRLMEPHRYIDNVVDYPILSAETIEHVKKQEEQEQVNQKDTAEEK